MIFRPLTVFALALAVLNFDVNAAALANNVSPAFSSPLEARASAICCGLAPNVRFIQLVCQYMAESCGGFSNCLPEGRDRNWCHYCVVVHPEDPGCTTLTWPPIDDPPVGKRDTDDATILAVERRDDLEHGT